jgi:hypothetical protein
MFGVVAPPSAFAAVSIRMVSAAEAEVATNLPPVNAIAAIGQARLKRGGPHEAEGLSDAHLAYPPASAEAG